jgi:hypothetical protein
VHDVGVPVLDEVAVRLVAPRGTAVDRPVGKEQLVNGVVAGHVAGRAVHDGQVQRGGEELLARKESGVVLKICPGDLDAAVAVAARR